MQLNGYEMNTRADSPLLHEGNDLVASDRQLFKVEPQHVEMPRVAAVRLVGRKLELLDIREGIVVGLRIQHAGPDESLEFSKLVDPHCGLNVAEVVLEARIQHFVIPVAPIGITV